MIVSDCSMWMWGWGSCRTQVPPEHTHFSCMSSLSCKTVLKQWEKNKADRFGKNHFWLAEFRRMGNFETTALLLWGWNAQSISSPPFSHLKGEILFSCKYRSNLRKKKRVFLIKGFEGNLHGEFNVCVCLNLCEMEYTLVHISLLLHCPSLKHLLLETREKAVRKFWHYKERMEDQHSLPRLSNIPLGLLFWPAIVCLLGLDRRWDVTDEVLDEGRPKLWGKLGQYCSTTVDAFGKDRPVPDFTTRSQVVAVSAWVCLALAEMAFGLYFGFNHPLLVCSSWLRTVDQLHIHTGNWSCLFRVFSTQNWCRELLRHGCMLQSSLRGDKNRPTMHCTIIGIEWSLPGKRGWRESTVLRASWWGEVSLPFWSKAALPCTSEPHMTSMSLQPCRLI